MTTEMTFYSDIIIISLCLSNEVEDEDVLLLIFTKIVTSRYIFYCKCHDRVGHSLPDCSVWLTC